MESPGSLERGKHERQRQRMSYDDRSRGWSVVGP